MRIEKDMKQLQVQDSDISNSTFNNVMAHRLNFENCYLAKTSYVNVNMEHTSISDANLRHFSINGAQWGGATFTGIGYFNPSDPNQPKNDIGVSFECCNFTNATLNNCDLTKTTLTNCKVDGLVINGYRLDELIQHFEKTSQST